jgi:PAS domain S-box-containing protein
MVIFLIVLEIKEVDYYYKYISKNINYYLPFYTKNRIGLPLNDFIKGKSYETQLYSFLDNTVKNKEYTESFTVSNFDTFIAQPLNLTLKGYNYQNLIFLVGSKQLENDLEETLFQEDYIFLVRWGDSKEDFIDDISDNVITLLEYTKEELLVKPYIELIHIEDRLTFKEEFNSYIEQNSLSFYQKYRLISKSGKEITVLDHSCQIIKDEKKRIIGYLRDITLEMEISTQLKELVTLDETNFNSDILIKIEWDQNLKITRWNSEANNILGWGEDIVGKSLKEINLFSDDDSIKMQGQFKRLFSQEVDSIFSSFVVQKKQGGFVNTKWNNTLIKRGGELRILSSVIDQSQEALLTNRLAEMETRTDLLLKTLSETKLSNDVFAKLIHNPLTANPEGLIKAEIIIRKLEEEITRLNDTVFHNNGNNLLTELANLKYDTKDIREELNTVKEGQSKVSSELSNLLNINILNLGKNLNFKNLTVLLVVSYIVFAQLLPGVYIQFIKPGIQQINKELKHIEGRKD